MTFKGQLEPPPETFLTPLLELRDYYAGMVEEYERLYTQARSHLDHVEALLSTWSPSQENHIAKLESADVTPSLPPAQKFSPNDISESDHNLEESTASELLDSDNLEVDNSSATTTDTNEYQSPSPQPEIAPPPEPKEQTSKVQDYPMLPEYQNSVNRIEAIRKLLQKHRGTVCHIDFIVRSLYGELEPTVFKVVKGRVQSSLTQGKGSSWVAIPDEPGCYTLDLSLLSSSRNGNSTKTLTSKKKKPLILPKNKVVPMLTQYEGQFLIDALTSLLEENAGKIMTVAEVINGLYGEIDAEDLREVKSKVLNELSRGYRTGRFARVPDTVGLYTWDVSLIPKAKLG
ncbi:MULTISPECIES: hypothetical protein [unclassified Tolypothrix]|uniref:hypothetical protein n=1 Tax=unclassified Tolypothrix TaxID=2649714 RepID=UPI0005EABDE3|nr:MULTISPECIES: hypothetical protein [unclassified Tolypothrix]BAY92818.1 hypothetical protein NIES3275_48550 [Microchaete diplosiphon NIES-3275]EKF04115.1 hypothetical protein FDUTEX481_02814 [Tolypothrix sp. PCC 7601]MBE9088039.1 hypothetical protein [Tolypothrix sp. LEGE 11397]UYD26737.1 hypothetical protein HGR01_01035 [Tolypothrix sp. PCC 7712]UYD37405.1 hypothetical protein HG267_17780 [Tolypothrix sp. PCC 7601]